MSDNIHSLTVTLENDRRDDDIEHLQNAIRQFKGVLAVTTQVSDPVSYMAEIRAQDKMRDKILDVLYSKPKATKTL